MPRRVLAGPAANRSTYLLILGDREGLAWVLHNRRMAFTESRVTEIAELRAGDQLLLYTSRGCYRNPTRDRGRVIGEAEARHAVARLKKPIPIGEREFSHTCDIQLKSLAPFRDGVMLTDLVPKLDVFPDARSWSARMRRPLLKLPPNDARLLLARLASIARPADENIRGYLDWLEHVATAQQSTAQQSTS